MARIGGPTMNWATWISLVAFVGAVLGGGRISQTAAL